ncbi:MAG TPA: DUF4097 family beta strand repeat-containing protein [Savagea sp.]
MEAKKKQILQLVEDGTITAEEAIVLLSKLNDTPEQPKVEEPTLPKQAEQEEQEEQSSQEDPFAEATDRGEQFFRDVKSDVQEIGTQFMKFFQTAVDQVKSFDVNQIFDAKVSFTREFTVKEPLERLDIEVFHGSVNIVKGTSEETTLFVDAAFFDTADEAKADERFTKEFLYDQQGDTLYIQSQLKTARMNCTLTVPAHLYDKVTVKTWNGAVSIEDLRAKQVKVSTKNGKVHFVNNEFEQAKVETANGKVYARGITGEDLEIETFNGAIYVDGSVEEIEAESVNGPIAITTTHPQARSIEAESFAGAVEIYLPKEASTSGKLQTNVGKLTVDVLNATVEEVQDSLFETEVQFEVEGSSSRRLQVKAKTNAGTITVK